MLTVLKQIKATIKERALMSLVYLILTLFVIGSLIITWLFILETIKKESSSKHIKELMEIRVMNKADYAKRVAENFNAWKHPYYKSLWGLALLQEMEENNDTAEARVAVANRLLQERGLPSVIKDAVKIYLVRLNPNLGEELSEQLIKSVKSRSPFFLFALETRFNKLLLDNKRDECHEIYKEIEKLGPSKVLDRTSELLYIARYQPYLINTAHQN